MTERGVDRRRALGSIAAALAAPLVGCGAGPRRPIHRTGETPRTEWSPAGEPRGHVILVHGLGTRPALWDLPGSGGLAPTLAAQGYRVIAPDLSGRASLSDWRTAIEHIAGELPRPPFGVGLDLGGTALYAARIPFAGRIGIGAPIASGGFSAAMRGVLTAAGAPTWRSLGRRTVGGRSLVRLLLTDGLPRRIHQPLVRDALGPMPEALRRQWYQPGARRPVPALLDGLPPPGAPWGPTLVVTAPGDGLAPPWQCNPWGFGRDWPGLTHRMASRVTGDEREFNHLDLVVHPDARRRVWPSMLRWLHDHAATAAGRPPSSEAG